MTTEPVLRLDLDAIAQEAEALGWTITMRDPLIVAFAYCLSPDDDAKDILRACITGDGYVDVITDRCQYQPWAIVGPLYAAIARHATTTEG